MEMSGDLLDAFIDHLEAQSFRKWTADMDAAEAAAWEPVRQHLVRMRKAPTMGQLRELRGATAAHSIAATPDWPPVAIPGRPGWWRHCLNGEQTDLPTREPTQKGAA